VDPWQEQRPGPRPCLWNPAGAGVVQFNRRP